jgi:acyl carrier protein
MTALELEDAVRAVLAVHVDVPADAHAPLSLDSFTIVVVLEDLERRLHVVMRASEATAAVFHSVASLCAHLRSLVPVGP